MRKLATKIYIKALHAKNKLSKCLKDESGETNIIAIILILAIVIALAIVFKDNLKQLFDKIWGSLFNDVDNVIK